MNLACFYKKREQPGTLCHPAFVKRLSIKSIETQNVAEISNFGRRNYVFLNKSDQNHRFRLHLKTKSTAPKEGIFLSTPFRVAPT